MRRIANDPGRLRNQQRIIYGGYVGHIDLDLQNSFLFMAWRCTAYRPITGLRKQIQASLFASFKFCGLSPIHYYSPPAFFLSYRAPYLFSYLPN